MTNQNEKDQFSFEISLSVLNHLGRNLYRSFMTVLGEAISNSWDADAENVWIYIDRENGSFVIKDDGSGMNADEFQNKFLKIGYSKRKDGSTTTKNGRPYIGRKGIGKLALLSCASKVSVLTRTSKTRYVGGVIDNSGLDQAIQDDLNPGEYKLGTAEDKLFSSYKKGHRKGTIIYFDDMKDGIRNSTDYLKKLIALYFRFSLIDKKFNIYVNGQKITYKHLDSLAQKTQFLWKINEIKDPYVTKKLEKLPDIVLETKTLDIEGPIRGFIASVDEPKSLKILTTDEKLTIDLFVNGRLREKDILKHMPSARIVESYLYGQIHYDELDAGKDRFTSSREGIIADDKEYKEFLESVRENILAKVISDWDKWRLKHRKDGDPDNPQLSKKQRRSRELFNAVSDEYALPSKSVNKEKVNTWVEELEADAQFNFTSYAECFISENLIRKLIEDKKLTLTPEAENERDRWKKAESDNKSKANVSIEIRRLNTDLSYLSMDHLANLADKAPDKLKDPGLSRDASEYKPIRDAVAHTALLTDVAKNRLTTVYENIKARIKTLLSIP